jgi:hypothetical protein
MFIALAVLAALVLMAPPSPSSLLKVSFSLQATIETTLTLFSQTQSRPVISLASSKNRISRLTLDFQRWAASVEAAAVLAVMVAVVVEAAVVEVEAQVHMPLPACSFDDS